MEALFWQLCMLGPSISSFFFINIMVWLPSVAWCSILLLLQIVILISQIRVNSMTVVRMKSIDYHDLVGQFGKFSSLEGGPTSNVEQVCIYGTLLYICFLLFCWPCLSLLHRLYNSTVDLCLLSRNFHVWQVIVNVKMLAVDVLTFICPLNHAALSLLLLS